MGQRARSRCRLSSCRGSDMQLQLGGEVGGGGRRAPCAASGNSREKERLRPRLCGRLTSPCVSVNCTHTLTFALAQHVLKAEGKYVKWQHFKKIFRQDCLRLSSSSALSQSVDCPRLTAKDTKGRSGLDYMVQSPIMKQKLNYNMHTHALLMRFMTCAHT